MSPRVKPLIWITGRPGSGKTTVARALALEIKNSCVLDGEDVRKTLCQDLGFTSLGRKENAKRVAEVGKILLSANVIPIVALVSPLETIRTMVRDMLGDHYVQVWTKASEECCRQRKPEVYKRFTGVLIPFLNPLKSDVILDTENESLVHCVDLVLTHLRWRESQEGTDRASDSSRVDSLT